MTEHPRNARRPLAWTARFAGPAPHRPSSTAPLDRRTVRSQRAGAFSSGSIASFSPSLQSMVEGVSVEHAVRGRGNSRGGRQRTK